jgi:SAM-dependent methyltransferase
MVSAMKLARLLEKRRTAWNEAATRSAMNYIDTRRNDWDLASFIDSGEELIALHVDPWLLRSGLNAHASTALDIGCGLGRLSRALSRRFAEVIGVDISENMVQRAAEINADHRNIQFRATSGRDLAVSDRSIDFCFSALTFQHIPSTRIIERYMAEIGRVLVRGGYFLVQVACPVRPAFLNICQNLAVSTDMWKHWAALKHGRQDQIAIDAFSGVSISERRFARICRRYHMELIDVARDSSYDQTYWAYGRLRAEVRS